MLVDRAVGWLPPMTEVSGYAAREAFDKDLAESAARVDAEMSGPWPVPVFPVGSVLHLPERTLAVADGGRPRRRSDELRASWGVHVQSDDSTPGGVKL